MANKEKTAFVCTECGYDTPKWSGKCPACGRWNTFVEQKINEKPTEIHKKAFGTQQHTEPTQLSEIESSEEIRYNMFDSELNRVLGGGLVKGSLVLLGGEPGIGKSTLILQTALQVKDKKILYVSGEESARQIKLRAERLSGGDISQTEHLNILCETSLENIYRQIKELQPEIVVIDSIQTISTENADSSPGSITQVRECAASLLKYAKESNTRK